MKKEHTKQSLLELLKPYRVYGDKLSSVRKETLFDKAYELNLLVRENNIKAPQCMETECWIPLKDINNKIIEWTLIDKSDFNEVSKYSWHLFKQNNTKYANNNNKILLHIYLLGKAPENHIIDHINHNGLDNTKKNLRFVCRSLNSQNKKKKEGTTSKYYGVSISEWGWAARHSSESLGYFKIETHAAFAYDTFIKLKYNGEGKINNIEKPEGYVEYVKKIKSTLPRGVVKSGKNNFKTQYWDLEKKKYIHLGMFDTTEQASKIYEEYRKKEEHKAEYKWLSQPILRNVDGIAILPVNITTNKKTFALVDDDLWHNFMKRKWHTDDNGYICALRTRLHQEVITNTDKNKIIDHIYNKLDNRRNSLRINTWGGNSHHRPSTGKSELKGVYSIDKKFMASLSFEKKEYYLGRYPTKELAAYAYNFGALQFYKDNASLNKIEKNDELNKWEWNKDTLRLTKITI